jgi:levansucrase
MSDQDAGSRGEAKTPAWTREQAAAVGRTEGTVAPIVYPPERRIDPSVHIWDTWLLRNRDGTVAEIDGWRVCLSLTAPSDLLPGKRHDVAAIRYFYSRDGRRWHPGGRVFSGGELGSRQWAGSALYDDGDLYLYYTAAGERGEADLSYTQHIAMATGGTVVADEEGLAIEGPWDHRSLLRPDGHHYETEAQSRGMIYTFRDPWFYEDPATGRTWLLFEGNTPVPEGSEACGGDPAQQEFNGSVGLAESPTGDPTDWELRPPLLDAVCVNQELERPHVVRRDGRYYLFVSSHRHTFAPGLDGVDGLYGFVADSLRGTYRPLNGSGLVVANPENAPFQAYSWLAFDHPEDLLVNSFFGYFDYDRPSLDDVALLPESEQFRRFGGTLAPTLRVRLDGDRSRIVRALDHGHIPVRSERLPGSPYGERAGEGDPSTSGYVRRDGGRAPDVDGEAD